MPRNGRDIDGAGRRQGGIRGRFLQPGRIVVGAAIVVPLVLFALAAWQSYVLAIRNAEGRAERTVRILEEHALEVLQSYRIALAAIAVRTKDVDWTSAEQTKDVNRFLKTLQNDLRQVASITIVDGAGDMVASGRGAPVPAISFTDRDWYKALREENPSLPYISSAYIGRQSRAAIFNVAARLPSTSAAAFAGAIAISVDRSYFESFYRSIEPELDHSVVLVRADGAILAAYPPTPLSQLAANSVLRAKIRGAASGAYQAHSYIDGEDRVFAFRQIGPYPVFVRFGIAREAALGSWRNSLVAYGLVAAITMLCLVAAAWLALRQTRREREATERWRKATLALEQEAAERQLAESQVRHLQKMEAVGQLTGGIAHDFNNMLSVIVGGLTLAQRRLSRGDTDVAETIGLAMDGANRATGLIQRLLAFSRKQPLQPRLLCPATMIEDLSDLLRQSLDDTVCLRTVCDEDPWSVEADASQLENAILNLVVNARDAMPTGGEIVITTNNVYVSAEDAGPLDAQAGPYVRILVADDGTGMPPDVAARAFDPFFTTKEVGKGTGLGLSQTYGFVKQSNGHIDVTSKVGVGTTFSIYLPRALLPTAGDARAGQNSGLQEVENAAS